MTQLHQIRQGTVMQITKKDQRTNLSLLVITLQKLVIRMYSM